LPEFVMPNPLPEIDLAPFIADAHSRPGREVVARLRDACHGPGFCYLVGHGVPPDLDAAIMHSARQFFALPEAERRALAIASSPHFRGYTVLGGEITKGVSDWREQLDVGAERAPIVQGAGVPAWTRLREPSQWPASQPGLRPVLLRWQAEATTLLLRVLRAMAPALGQPGDVFRPIYAGDPHQLLKMIRYPGRDATEGGDQGVGADCRWSTTVAGSTRCRCPVRSW
jgi:isopenicillin N synthase-like dioxygenase